MDLSKDIRHLADKNLLAQGYIFYGRSPAGFSCAQSLANYLETKTWAMAERILLDAKIINGANQEERPKTQKSEEVGIEEARGARLFLWQKPIASPKRTLIVNRADLLTTEAQNAILKIAEEPPANALVILIVREPELLLPTILSRFQKLYFGRREEVSLEAVALVKAFLGAGPAEQKELINEITGAPLKLEQFVAGLLQELRRDTMKNWKVIKELLYRWRVINQLNVNKKLQIESVCTMLKN